MIDDLGKLLDRVSSPADLAVLLLAGPLAFVLDAGLDVVTFLPPPGYAAIIAASLALGVKKTLETRLAPRREVRAGEIRRRELRDRAVALAERVADGRLPDHLAVRLRHELDLYDARITTEQQFDTALGDYLAEYRFLVDQALNSSVRGQRR
ncbi:hypothetical protein [Kribbella kalugense]|uniref:Uncharacterized protein n=1 Tax=Kribbella kalugense TaxID=2512221 RepID=A0A4R8A0I9_9ACTN|nr:hypothetical protein [Kribbella kalugense]TDW23989.1 hypothetical protein EV650_2850 [Kribbella kalugense]